MTTMNSAYTPERLADTFSSMRDRRAELSQGDLPRGVDGASAAAIGADGGRTFREIHRLIAQSDAETGASTRYRFSPLFALTRRGSSGKDRTVVIPTVRDQITLKAMSNVLTSAMARVGIPQPETDAARTVRRVIREARNSGKDYVLRTDIASFYDTIPHDGLLAALEGIGIDAATRDLVAKLLRTPHRRLANGAEAVCSLGVPQGASVSGLLAQIYVHRIDGVFGGRKDLFFARYVDDILLAAPDAIRRAEARLELEEEIGKLGLALNKDKTKETTFAEGFRFVGPDFRGNEVLVPEEKVDAWFHQLRRVFHGALETGDTPGRAVSQERFAHAVQMLNAELSGLTGRHLRLYHVADNTGVYREVDRRVRGMLAPWMNRLALRPGGSGVTSAFRWAYEHKRSPHKALEKARQRFGKEC